jgi:hypothetical protein
MMQREPIDFIVATMLNLIDSCLFLETKAHTLHRYLPVLAWCNSCELEGNPGGRWSTFLLLNKSNVYQLDNIVGAPRCPLVIPLMIGRMLVPGKGVCTLSCQTNYTLLHWFSVSNNPFFMTFKETNFHLVDLRYVSPGFFSIMSYIPTIYNIGGTSRSYQSNHYWRPLYSQYNIWHDKVQF